MIAAAGRPNRRPPVSRRNESCESNVEKRDVDMTVLIMKPKP